MSVVLGKVNKRVCNGARQFLSGENEVIREDVT